VEEKDRNTEETAVSVPRRHQDCVSGSQDLITCLAERSFRGGSKIPNILVIPTIVDTFHRSDSQRTGAKSPFSACWSRFLSGMAS